jgi:hypothetical protein
MTVLTVYSGGIPVGNYTASFSGIEPSPENKERGYPAGIKWKFTVVGGPHAGQMTSRITNNSPTAKNAAGKMLCGLLGRALKDGEQVDIDQFLGRPYMVVVSVSPQGVGTRVDAVVPISPA